MAKKFVTKAVPGFPDGTPFKVRPHYDLCSGRLDQNAAAILGAARELEGGGLLLFEIKNTPESFDQYVLVQDGFEENEAP